MIGLEKGIVRVDPHHPGWHDVFEEERRVLQEHIGDQVLDVQHVGSTAVPGLDAKPIIDITIALASPGVIPAAGSNSATLVIAIGVMPALRVATFSLRNARPRRGRTISTL